MKLYPTRRAWTFVAFLLLIGLSVWAHVRANEMADKGQIYDTSWATPPTEDAQ